jgi:hypothetical protein
MRLARPVRFGAVAFGKRAPAKTFSGLPTAPGAGTIAALYSLTERARLAFIANPQQPDRDLGRERYAGGLPDPCRNTSWC